MNAHRLATALRKVTAKLMWSEAIHPASDDPQFSPQVREAQSALREYDDEIRRTGGVPVYGVHADCSPMYEDPTAGLVRPVTDGRVHFSELPERAPNRGELGRLWMRLHAIERHLAIRGIGETQFSDAPSFDSRLSIVEGRMRDIPTASDYADVCRRLADLELGEGHD